MIRVLYVQTREAEAGRPAIFVNREDGAQQRCVHAITTGAVAVVQNGGDGGPLGVTTHVWLETEEPIVCDGVEF